ncbi:hypothetical protein NDU88_004807 [Pleurodeles waltl]|uniref:Uncharacterized protein n=1 Tax=Pleurodeles waltl TaxID=8319 RepID=A0AAV7UKA5_PLEWA|nr:hypothetical protein NDU88_004807 [Pleurodeles waltl]
MATLLGAELESDIRRRTLPPGCPSEAILLRMPHAAGSAACGTDESHKKPPFKYGRTVKNDYATCSALPIQFPQRLKAQPL